MGNDSATPAAPTPIAVAVVEHNDSFLVGIRPAGVPLAGLAEFPGGKIKPGESPEQAAVRECLEETGLAVEVVSAYRPHVQSYEHGAVALHFFACAPRRAESTNEPPASLTPHPPFAWMPRAELARCEFPAGNRLLIDQLLGRADS